MLQENVCRAVKKATHYTIQHISYKKQSLPIFTSKTETGMTVIGSFFLLGLQKSVKGQNH